MERVVVHRRALAAGIDRPLGGPDMAWLRGLRQRKGLDERKEKSESLTTFLRR